MFGVGGNCEKWRLAEVVMLRAARNAALWQFMVKYGLDAAVSLWAPRRLEVACRVATEHEE